MQVEKYLKNHQPIVYQTFKNSLESGHLSHAYLISGEKGSPLLEVAIFLGKSLICDNPTPFACDECITCINVDAGNFPDFFIFNGEKETIKKGAVSSIEAESEKSAYTSKGTRIYVMHLIENMTVEAVNSLLKFLEEPGKKIYAFLTTNNKNSILPTIVSRCQSITLKTVDREEIIKEAVEEGVPEEDAEFLSYFFNNAELIVDTLKNKESKEQYNNAKEAVSDVFEALSEDNSRKAIYTAQSKVIPLIKNKETARYFIDLLSEIYDDLINIKYGNQPILKSYDKILLPLVDKIPHIEESLVEILKCRNIINTNVNIPLLVDHITFKLTKEPNND